MFRADEGPFFKVKVTGPEASAHVRFTTELPARYAVAKKGADIVNSTAWVSAKVAAARKIVENCISKI